MTLVWILTCLLAAASILPWVPWPSGIVRVCEFPRLQIAALAILLMLALFMLDADTTERGFLMALQGLILLAQGRAAFMYTPFHPVQSVQVAGPSDPDRRLRIFSANVKMSNRSYALTLDVAERADPDIAVFMEVDDDWITALAALRSTMPHSVECPRDDSYGMLLLSRLPLVNPETRYLVFDTVPSIKTGVQLRSGDIIRLYAVHPEPPVPYEDTIGRDGELVLVAHEVKRDPLPAIVAGDLNDVAWSRTTRRFQRLSGLLDPRVGRGFFNTFDARFPGLRWPLDHLFHDARFRLSRIEVLPYVGSDHFPILFELVLKKKEASDAPVAEPDKDDKQEAAELGVEAESLDRRPVGENWERS
jgi:endonuclease/exonuclease/phosphatase (EEP) superfamily protein YafD